MTGSVFDVGAHIGNHTLYFGAVCGLKVYAWEPHDGSLKQLHANLALNPQLEVEVFDWAAGEPGHPTGACRRGCGWSSTRPGKAPR